MNSSKARIKNIYIQDGPEITVVPGRKSSVNKQENDKSKSKGHRRQTEKVPNCQNILKIFFKDIELNYNPKNEINSHEFILTNE